MKMKNNSEPDNNNTDKTNVELNNLYNHYFMRPEDIEAVYDKPERTPFYSGVIGGFVYDKSNKNMHNIEAIIRNMYYRLPNLTLPDFFDIKHTRPDLIEGRKAEIAEMYSVADMILSDVDKITDVRTKKRILYYFKCVVNATRGCAFSEDISKLIALAIIRNNLAAPADNRILTVNNKRAIMVAKMHKDSKIK